MKEESPAAVDENIKEATAAQEVPEASLRLQARQHSDVVLQLASTFLNESDLDYRAPSKINIGFRVTDFP